jgi:cell pole-organizing protein PopZ
MSGTTEMPGMDEIRASISRIIADDEQARVSPSAAGTPAGAGSASVHPLRPVPPPEEAAATRAASADARLVSSATETAAGAAFAELERSLDNQPRSLEDLVAEMLRPMLKAWLDENLPALVERLVQDEIERLARGRR